MVNHTPGTVLDRAVRRFKHRLERGGGESGSLILDILIGMAIFALVAIIAVSAVGQYRMRAYTQAAMSDAEAVANAINATITDNAGDATATFPTGLLTADDFTALEVTPTSSGSATSAVTIIPGEVDPTAFIVCVEYRGAYAEYESDKGLTASGNIAEDNYAGCDTTYDDSTGDGSGNGDGGETETPEEETAIAGPPSLDGTTVVGNNTATLTWPAVDGATDYSVYVDGSTTPAWTGTTSPADLSGLPGGEHTAVVTATVDGKETDPSPPFTFTIYADNDLIVNAHPIPDEPDAEWRSRDYSTAGTTAAEPGEAFGNDLFSRWWTVTAPRDTTYFIDVVEPVVNNGSGYYQWYYPELYVWKSDATATDGLGTTIVNSGAISPDRVEFQAKKGETFKIRVSAGGTNHENRPYRLMVGTGPLNDFAAGAKTVPADIAPLDPWVGPEARPVYARTETGEPSGSNTLWWTFTPSQSGTYNVATTGRAAGVATYAHHTFMVWEAAADTPVTSLGTPYAQRGNSYSSQTGVTFTGIAGKTYRIRISGNTDIPFRPQVIRGPANDFLAAAAQVPNIAKGDSWTSADLDNTRAGTEPGETGYGAYGMWWTYTPTQSGTLKVDFVQHTDGSPIYEWRYLYAYRSTSTDVTALGTAVASDGYMNAYATAITFPVVAGETYKIRAGSRNGPGKYRLRLALN